MPQDAEYCFHPLKINKNAFRELVIVHENSTTTHFRSSSNLVSIQIIAFQLLVLGAKPPNGDLSSIILLRTDIDKEIIKTNQFIYRITLNL